MTSNSSQQFESFVPVYDTIPEKWEEARELLVETLKKMSNEINRREIGNFLDEEQLSGKFFIPSAEMYGTDSSDSQQTRTVFRKVLNASSLVAGANTVAHGLTIDANFSIIDMWCAASDFSTTTYEIITDSNVVLDTMNVTVTSPQAFQRAFIILEYMYEV